MRLNILGFEFGFGAPNRSEAKSSETAPLIYLMYQGNTRGAWTKRNYAQYSDDAYKRNVIAYRAIRDVAGGAAKVPLKVMIGDKEADENHPLMKLLNKPNPWQSHAEFFEAVIAYIMLTGNTYIEGVGPDNAPPLELWTLRPDRTKVLPGPYGPAGYIYEVNGQIKEWRVDPITAESPVLHMRLFNPLDDWYGMSPVEAAAYAIDGHNMAGEWNQGLLQNGARPSGALVYAPTNGASNNLSEKQFDTLKEQLNAAYSGTRNAGRPMILEGGLKWESMSMTPAEMDWINGKHVSAREIALTFGVPPMCLGIPGDNTYSNYQEARQALYQDTVIPTLSALCDGLNGWLAPRYGDNVRIIPYIEDLPALSLVREKRWDAVQSSTWMTTNEKRLATGMEAIECPDADEIFISSTMVPLTGASQLPEVDETPPVDGEPEPEDDTTEEEEDEGKPKKPAKMSNLERLITKAAAEEASRSAPAPDTRFDVPYGAGMSYSRKTWYIDRSIPRYLDVKGAAVDLWSLWYVHEAIEHNWINHDEEYPQAHAKAEEAEKKALADLYPGIAWKDYAAACAVILDRAYTRSKSACCSGTCGYKTPMDLDHRQYQQQNDVALLHLGHNPT